ncbi:MAG: site-2 protease family protein, partial [Nitrospira defluvii]|nr:site-2 protease family protein [Nitrospira defluvii]
MRRDESDQSRFPDDLTPASSDDSEEDEWVDEERPLFSSLVLPGLLFLLTVFTVLWAGAYQTNTNPLVGPWTFLMEDPLALWKGVPFAATLLGILVTHELGHYVLSRIHGVPASLPLFVPGLPHFVGTFGAIIRMRAPMTDRRALFDIGVAGPIAGFVVAVVALVIGLRLSTVVPIQTSYGLHL